MKVEFYLRDKIGNEKEKKAILPDSAEPGRIRRYV